MCGIYVSISRTEPVSPDSQTVEALKARGPDSYHTLTTSALKNADSISSNGNETVILTFVATVLALRGHVIQQQPLVDEATGSFLCWNGEAWTIDEQPVEGNDSLQVFNLLISAINNSQPSTQAIEKILTRITGPFSFVFFDNLSSTVYYGRDTFGRRSLIVEQSHKHDFVISSIATTTLNVSSHEVPSGQLHYVSLKDDKLSMLTSPCSAPVPDINRNLPQSPCNKIPSSNATTDLIRNLQESLHYRVLNIPNHTEHQLRSNSAKIAVLFSGGIDCSLLARLTHDLVSQDEPIDLLNVAFENPRLMTGKDKDVQSPYEICPDRITGRAAYEELSQVCPNRIWRFISINIAYSEAKEHRTKIVQLMKPHNTEMDLSIAMALYFASRGKGYCVERFNNNTSPHLYTTSARVLLSGLGADELFGGYSRHTTAFNRGGFESLIDELELDFTRIGSRNLGRDDRVVSHWGKEIRYPFLDEKFISFALSLPIWEKCGFREGHNFPRHPEGKDIKFEPKEEKDLDPAKMILRLALWKLGMFNVANEKKRAIQFGARTAKMEFTTNNTGSGRKKKGTDVVDVE